MTASPEETTATAAMSASDVQWDAFHRDPILDVVIKSSVDNVYFRASSYALKRECSLFDGMLSTIPNPHMTPETAIPLDYSSTSIRLFLDRCVAPILTDYPTLDFKVLHEHRKLVLYLDCSRLLPYVQRAYDAMCRAKPFEVLLAASVDDDLPSSRSALVLCAGASIKLDATNIYELVGKVRKNWQLPLLKCLLYNELLHPYSSAYHHGSPAQFKICWPTLDRADRFIAEVRKEEAEAAKAADALIKV